MTKVTLPYAGTLRWQYRDFAFSSGKTLREVQNRYLKKASDAAETTYALVRDDSGDAGRFIHDYTCINDPGTIGQKCWFFDTNSAVYSVGLNTKYEDRPAAGQTAMRRVDYTWTRQSTYGKNPYILAALTTVDPGTGYQKQSKVEQAVDQFGNSTQTKLYSYDSLTVPARVYSSTLPAQRGGDRVQLRHALHPKPAGHQFADRGRGDRATCQQHLRRWDLD